jgi:hypothetical protein
VYIERETLRERERKRERERERRAAREAKLVRFPGRARVDSAKQRDRNAAEAHAGWVTFVLFVSRNFTFVQPLYILYITYSHSFIYAYAHAHRVTRLHTYTMRTHNKWHATAQHTYARST